MSRTRVAVLIVLVALPALFLMGEGSYHLWETGWFFLAWCGMALCLSLAYVLAWRWQRANRLLRMDFPQPLHWTDRDELAWQLVEARAKAGDNVDADKLSDPKFYFDTAQEMALELAKFYHPSAKDPYSNLTLPEILAVGELAAHDLSQMVQTYLPGGHLLTINDWKRARQAVDWYRRASNVYWAAAALFNPVQTGARWLATRFGLTAPLQKLQQNIILWFYVAFVQRLGNYLIELHSGRLKVGAERYRELLERHGPPRRGGEPESVTVTPAPKADGAVQAPVTVVPAAPPPPPARQVTLAICGQVKAGKSSTINALLGEQRAKTDVLPATAGINRYELQQPGMDSKLVLLDTVGYHHTGATEDQLHSTEEAAQEADLLLLVVQARDPARQADVEMLDRLRDWFADRPQFRMPPVLAVMTHIDMLTPAMEWSPPYDWKNPTRTKEKMIRDALATVRDQFGERIVGVVPVCAAPGKVYGIQEDLLPALARQLDEAHAVALLRCLYDEANERKVRKVFGQLLAAGQQALHILWESIKK